MMIVLGMGILLCPWLARALDPDKSVFQYNIQTWTRQGGGLAINGIRDVIQTRDGCLWLGTQKGLVRFDGAAFTMVSLPAHYWHQNVGALSPSKKGGMWFGTEPGACGFFDGVARFDTMESVGWVKPEMDARAVLEARDGSVWIGYLDGVARHRPNGEDQIMTNGMGAVLEIHEDSKGRVWIGTVGRGVFCWQDGRMRELPDPVLQEKGEMVFAIAVDQKDRIWVGTQLGLHCYDSEFKPLGILPQIQETRALLVDRHGVLWIGTRDLGLARYRGEQLDFLNKSKGLSDDFVLSLCEDREGSIWVGTRDGLTQLSDVKFPIVSVNEGLAAGAAHGVAAARNGGLWIAGSGGLSFWKEHAISNYGREAGLSTPYIKGVLEASNGDVYLINALREIEVVSQGKVIARHRNDDWPTGLAEDAKGVVVSVGGKLFRASASAYEPYTFDDGEKPPFDWIRHLHGCRDGSLLVATVNGLFRITDGRVKHWKVEHGLPGYDVLWVSEDQEGDVWAGLRTGMARIRNGNAAAITREHGLLENHILAIVPDDLGGLWLHSMRGILHTTKESVNAFLNGGINQIACVSYDGLESVKTVDTTEVEYSGCRTTDGRVWFPNPQGVVMINPRNVPANPLPPPVHIQRVRINGTDFTQREDSVPPRPGKGELLVEYSAITFISPQKVQYRYRLEGYESEWQEAGNRRSAFYANLKPKQYRFVVQACNADGVWNTAGDAVDVELPPSFYQTDAFQFLAVASGLVLLIALYRWNAWRYAKRQQKLQEANERLEARINERTHELAEQRNLLRTLIDHLPDNVFVKDTESRVIIDNVSHARRLGVSTPEEVVGKSDFDFFSREMAQKFFADEQHVIRTGESFDGEETGVDRGTGLTCWLRTTKVPLRDARGKIVGIAGINRDITERKEWEARMASMHNQLLEVSRRAGMAEVATSVLHNVGNVLNSVNVSAGILKDKIRGSNTASVSKVVELLRANKDDLAGFFTQGERGGKLIQYLDALAKHAETEKLRSLQELDSLVSNIDHIKDIVTMQQSYARVAGITEVVNPVELMEDALRMQQAGYESHGVKVSREFGSTPKVTVDRHKAIQVLVNLLENAKHACDANQSTDRSVTARVSAGPAGRVRFEVIDNGVGIPAENLTRIFSQGFTTRKEGHGFGLHSGALAAREMGGELRVSSDGLGEGAAFVLELPLTPPLATPQHRAVDSEHRSQTLVAV